MTEPAFDWNAHNELVWRINIVKEIIDWIGARLLIVDCHIKEKIGHVLIITKINRNGYQHDDYFSWRVDAEPSGLPPEMPYEGSTGFPEKAKQIVIGESSENREFEFRYGPARNDVSKQDRFIRFRRVI